ncbi:hypothetical protein PAXRUDRAFT_135342 [Paxillus rubicundulus Ve08.2h10]|uniref:Auxin efflux carrier n=1 Tax=Paxillus rubicundulus Ve08.2h10 TaxID=930991 RepID=A0A0D0E7T0_9AGAM|nr:hypothetical protein PAXRUDRAFT_135342 [Paxillus rubicundulus Ve08.2h10]
MSSLPAGELIWIAIQPLMRLFFCVACGFTLAKAGLFPAVVAKGVGQILLNVAIPALMFSKIVPAFNSGNIVVLGPLLLVALLFESIGIMISWIIKQLFWVPHRFRYGILAAGAFGNVGDIPTSVVMGVMASAPFNGTYDANLGVGYITVFILVMNITLFPLGGRQWVAMDFEGPDVSDEDVQEQLRLKHKKLLASLQRGLLWFSKPFRIAQGPDRSEITAPTLMSAGDCEKVLRDVGPESRNLQESTHPKESAFSPSSTIVQPEPIPTYSSDPGLQKHVVVRTTEIEAQDVGAPSQPLPRRFIYLCRDFVRGLLYPCSLATVISFIMAVIPPIKALFVTGVPGTNIPQAPDGKPPLAFIMDTASFIGAASVPMGLITLGSALARLHVPWTQLRSLPIGAIASLAAGRLIVTPIFGILICQGLTQVGLLDAGNKVLRFVCFFVCCVPTATTQVLLTQVYSGTGNAEHLAAFLIPQYVLMFGSMTVLTAFNLHLLFG